ncbi:MAG TPA: sigma-70 family RNA polymerase sigma factor [Pirellulaceae bacterium]|jgi:RNA polymerase sigma-70 factor (ECF subfamily)|nr:sigma-70 family RNA polymerase sigma factor [Pirellulaceae bacterium]
MSANRDGVSRSWVLAAVDEFEGRLTRYAIRLLGDEHSARDVVQYAFLRLCDAVPDEVHDHIGPWLFRVCRNRSLDVMRKNGRVESLSGSETEQLPARELDPAVIVERQDLGRWVYQLLGELATSQREVIELWLNDFSYQEISQITGRSEGHVRVIAHRGLSRLREHPRTRNLLDALPPPTAPSTNASEAVPLTDASYGAAAAATRSPTNLRSVPVAKNLTHL